LEATNNPVGEENLEKKDWILISKQRPLQLCIDLPGNLVTKSI